MVIRRSYHDACGMALALDLVGERWALLVVRELVLGPKRYTDLRADLPGISTTVLAHRLDELEQTGVVRRRRLAPPAGSTVYELTDWGQELEPVIRQLGRWGARSPTRRRDAHLSAAGLVLSLRTNYQPDGSDGFAATIELRLGEDRFTATVRTANSRSSEGARTSRTRSSRAPRASWRACSVVAGASGKPSAPTTCLSVVTPRRSGGS